MQTSGTGSETDTAMIYNPDNTPAVGAVVRFFVATDSTRTIAWSSKTDANGHYSVKGLAKGMYNMLAYSAKGLATGAPKMLAANDSLIGYQDSIVVLPDTVLVNPDTLEKPGSVTGIIGLQPNHNPLTVTVQVLGTDLYSNVDANGKFTLAPVAKGSYNLRLVTTLPDYTPTYKTIQTAGQKKDTLSDTLWLLYTGIPVVTGLAATYDTVNGIVHLSWNNAAFWDFQNYSIFRDDYNSLVLSAIPIAARGDTFFVDTVFKRNLVTGQFSFIDTNDYHFKYRVSVENNSSIRGETYKYVDIVAVSPTRVGMFKCATYSAAGIGGKYGQSSVVFNNKIWVIGGYDLSTNRYFSYVSSSTDGISWLDNGQAAFQARAWHTSVDFNNNMWVIAGQGSSGSLSDVWYSTDGVAWTQATANAEFASRDRHSSLIFNNKMWVIAGEDNSVAKNDVWYSTDGVAWTQATANAGFSPRCGHSSIVFDNKMWVIGGGINGTSQMFNDVWYSPDGVAWTQATANAAFSPRTGHSSLTFDNKMWIIAGADNSGLRNDVWYSTDGAAWTQVTVSTCFTPRSDFSSLVFNNEMWVIAGNAPIGASPFFLYDDVWYSSYSPQ